MARNRKTWQEKLATAKEKIPTARTFFCEKTKQQFVVPAVIEIEQLIRRVPRGRVLTIGQITETLRAKHKVEACCPMTTGIFAWILAHAADEAGGTFPWWRLLKTGGELNPKYPGKGATQRDKLEAEGHRIITKGKRFLVEGGPDALVRVKEALPAQAPRASEAIERKALCHDDFGLCLLLPKSHWPKLPEAGLARIKVNGTTRRVTVHRERCNCVGKGWHEHRYLSLPHSAGVTKGARVEIKLEK